MNVNVLENRFVFIGVNMKTIVSVLAFTFAVFGYAAEKPYFSYADVQAMGGHPMVGAGFRVQKGVHGFDFSGNTCPLSPPDSLNIFHVKSLYLIYPKQKGLYLGGGLGLLNDPDSIKVSGSFESAIGYQWKNRLFIEGNAIVPFKQSQALVPVWPGLTFGVGF
jgi:hypothetical protein